MLTDLCVWGVLVLTPCAGGQWSPLWAEVENTGTQREMANPPSAPCMTGNVKMLKNEFKKGKSEKEVEI